VDDKLREVFDPRRALVVERGGLCAQEQARPDCARCALVGMSEDDAGMIVAKVETRATALRLRMKAADATIGCWT